MSTSTSTRCSITYIHLPLAADSPHRRKPWPVLAQKCHHRKQKLRLVNHAVHVVNVAPSKSLGIAVKGQKVKVCGCHATKLPRKKIQSQPARTTFDSTECGPPSDRGLLIQIRIHSLNLPCSVLCSQNVPSAKPWAGRGRRASTTGRNRLTDRPTSQAYVAQSQSTRVISTHFRLSHSLTRGRPKTETATAHRPCPLESS